MIQIYVNLCVHWVLLVILITTEVVLLIVINGMGSYFTRKMIKEFVCLTVRMERLLIGTIDIVKLIQKIVLLVNMEIMEIIHVLLFVLNNSITLVIPQLNYAYQLAPI